MINERMRALGARKSVIRELFEYGVARKKEIGEDRVFDFSLGNPSLPAPCEVNREIARLIESEESVKLHGYSSDRGDADVREAIAEYINKSYGENITANCLYISIGAAAALTCALTAVVSEGEEVIVPTPYFPEYKVFIERCGGVVREVLCDEEMQLDISAIESAINERTAAIIINSPNNPTGAVYSEDTIASLCDALRRCEAKYGHTIYLISDEPYRELVYDGVRLPFVTKYYNDTIVCYSFSKSISLPGERIGYVLVSPRAENFTALYQAVCGAGRALGFVCAPSRFQYLIPSVLGVTSDLTVYDENRRRLYGALTEYGFDVVRPDGAFYLFLRAPSGDASAFCEMAKRREILLVPSDDFGCAGFARLAYCVSRETVERSLPAFCALAADCGLQPK